MERALARAAAVLVAAATLSGCIDIDFEPPYLVQTPRILGISAEPPESAFGTDLLFEALVVDEEGVDLPGQPGVELRWTVCLSVAEVVRSAGLGFGGGLEDDCDEGGDDLVRLDTEGLPEGSARLPGPAFFRLVSMLPMDGGDPAMPPEGAEGLDPRVLETLREVIALVGVPLSVRLEVRRDGELILTGFKRFAVTQREDPTTNPPPPRLSVGGRWLSARGGGDAHICAAEGAGGGPPTVAAGDEVELAPDPDEDPWLETYPVYALDGTLQRNVESAYYSWFSTGGDFDSSITQRPNREVTWTAPEEPGTYTVWVVVRDGHLGTSWCRAEVQVVGADG